MHATAVVVGRKGVLLRGASGSGKSDLALRLIDGGARLVADDVVEICRQGRGVVLRAPGALKGKMEVRGVGIVAVPAIARANLALVVDLVGADAVERFPETGFVTILGTKVKCLKLWAFEASAAVKLRLAVGGR